MRIWKKTDLAWAAGFIDGEGTFTLTRRLKPRLSYDLKISAGQTSIEPLEKLCSLFGGKSYMRRAPFGIHKKPMYGWQVCNKMAEKTARLLLPYLIVKKQRAILMLEYCDTKNKFKPGAGRPLPEFEKNKRNEMISTMHRLNNYYSPAGIF